jgi:hypothetical protein
VSGNSLYWAERVVCARWILAQGIAALIDGCAPQSTGMFTRSTQDCTLITLRHRAHCYDAYIHVKQLFNSFKQPTLYSAVQR